MIETILTYASMWAPSLVALLGILFTVIKAIGLVRKAIDELKQNTNIHDMNVELSRLTTQNKELVRCNKLLLDRITKITNYADEVDKE